MITITDLQGEVIPHMALWRVGGLQRMEEELF